MITSVVSCSLAPRSRSVRATPSRPRARRPQATLGRGRTPPQDGQAGGHHRQRSPAGAKLPAAGHQGAQAGRVEETGTAQVRDDVHGPVAGQAGHPVADPRRGVHVDVAVNPQHRAVAACGDGLQVKGVHAVSLAGWARCDADLFDDDRRMRITPPPGRDPIPLTGSLATPIMAYLPAGHRWRQCRLAATTTSPRRTTTTA
jgi:hypothetical protein